MKRPHSSMTATARPRAIARPAVPERSLRELLQHPAWIALLACALLLVSLLVSPGAGAADPAPVAAAPPAMKPISPDALLQEQTRHPEQVFVLDVRTPQEYAEGHVPGAVNVPYDQVAARLQDIPRDKDVVLYCRSGRRAGLAADVLAASGYTRLLHLDGDMQAWTAQGRPVEKP